MDITEENVQSKDTLWICDLACRKYTFVQLPTLVMSIILKFTLIIPKEIDICKSFCTIDINPKGARKGKWRHSKTRQTVTKYRLRQAVRYHYN